MDAITAQALGGWDSNQDARYAVNPDRMAEIPAEAVPAALALPGAKASGKKQKSSARTFAGKKSAKNESGWQDLNLQQPAPKAGPLPG